MISDHTKTRGQFKLNENTVVPPNSRFIGSLNNSRIRISQGYFKAKKIANWEFQLCESRGMVTKYFLRIKKFVNYDPRELGVTHKTEVT